MSNSCKIKRKTHKVVARIIDDAPLYSYQIGDAEPVVSALRRYLVQFPDKRRVWYPYNHPVVKMLQRSHA